ncbi:glycosyltransferase [Candidatus Parcubacteria bacterium]|nr:MAG: glycosyltransferase [Candidatus Parcubacteria bacterium]
MCVQTGWKMCATVRKVGVPVSCKTRQIVIPDILHVIEDFSCANTGITAVVAQLAGWQAGQGVRVGVYSTGKPDVKAPAGVDLFWDESFRYPASWRCPAGFAERLEVTVRRHGYNVLHLHGFWRAAPWVAQRVASRLRVPTVLTVHGQVESWAWHGQGRFKAWKKSLYWRLAGRKVLQSVSLVHAITPLEKQHLTSLFPGHEIVVIPNAVNLADFPTQSQGKDVPKHFFLFLGRIHPVKRIDWLIGSFAQASLPEDWELVIAGPEEDAAHAKALRALAAELGVRDRMRFVGTVYGDEKIRWLRSAWALVAPSYSEVVGMVNLEAAACYTPSITTRETGLLDWEEGGGLLVSGKDYASLPKALRKAAEWSLQERLLRGERSRRLVAERYSLDRVGQQWLEVYQGLGRAG